MKKIAKMVAVAMIAVMLFLPIADVHAAGNIIVEVPGASSGSGEDTDGFNFFSMLQPGGNASGVTPSTVHVGGVAEMTKTATPIGTADERTYKVELTVGGDASVDGHYGNIFILVDMTLLLGGNPVMPYYLRAIWNMCNTIATERNGANFCLIGYSDQVYVQTDWISSDNLGDPAKIIDPAYFTSNFTDQSAWHRPSIEQPGTLLGYLDTMVGYKSLAGNIPAGTVYNEGKADTTGMYLPDDILKDSGMTSNPWHNNGVNTETALKTVRDIIKEAATLNNHVVMFSSSPPTTSAKEPIYYNDPAQFSRATDAALDVYYEMSDTQEATFYMFGYEAFSPQQSGYAENWGRFVSTIGNNLDSEGNTRFTAEQLADMCVQVGWDHVLGTEADAAQKLTSRLYLNNAMQRVSAGVSALYTTRQEYAYGASLKDIVPEEFEILTNTITAAANGIPSGDVSCLGNTITWNIGNLKADEGPYTLSYEIQARESYFGGEVRNTNTEAVLSYKNASGGAEEQAFPVPAVYVPWRSSLTGSEHTFFYGQTPDNEKPDSLTIPNGNQAAVNNDYYGFDLKDANAITGGSLNDFAFTWLASEGNPMVETGTGIGNPITGEVAKLLYYCRPGTVVFPLEIVNPKLTGLAAMQGMLANTATLEEYITWLGAKSDEQLAPYREVADVRITVNSGALTLSKNVVNADQYPNRVKGKEFILQVRGPMNFDVTLQHGKSATLTGLKAGEYTITEVVPQNYQLGDMELSGVNASKSAVATISAAAPKQSVKVNNTLTNIEHFYQDIEITNKCLTVEIE